MFAVLQSAPSWILPFVFVLFVVITVHELGHFFVAKGCGVAIERFSIGFGRAIVSWRDRSGVEWRIGWIPIGGYVMFAGDENAASVPDANDLDELRRAIIAREGPAAVRKYLPFKPLWQRAAIAAAGPMANFLLATAIFSALFMTLGEPIIRARIGAVQPGSVAAAAGFQPGDLITRVGDEPIESFGQLAQLVSLRADVTLRFTVHRGSKDVVLTATPRRTSVADPLGGSDDVGQLGLTSSRIPSDVGVRRYDPLNALAAGAAQTWNVLSTTVYYLGRLLQGHENGRQLSGFIGIARMSHLVAADGARGEHGFAAQMFGSSISLISLVAVMSVSIGFANLLPIPVLDGGHLLFYAYEAVVRRPVAAAVQAVSYRVGLALLVGLMLFATTNDLQRINIFRFLGGPFS